MAVERQVAMTGDAAVVARGPLLLGLLRGALEGFLSGEIVVEQ